MTGADLSPALERRASAIGDWGAPITGSSGAGSGAAVDRPQRRRPLGRAELRCSYGRVRRIDEHMFVQDMLATALNCSNPACGALFAVYATTDAHGVAVCRYCGASVIEVAGDDSGISTDDDSDVVQVYVRRGPRLSDPPARL